jgi:hypothetical protein
MMQYRTATRLRQIAVVAFAVLTLTVPASGQQASASITGIVVDTTGQPLKDAEVTAQPGSRTTRSDSTGRFQLGGLPAAKYTVTARRLGFSAAQYYISLPAAGTAELEFVLTASTTQLDTVVVIGKAGCPRFSVQGFNCRRQSRDGVFLDRTDIDARNPEFRGDLFRDIGGIRVEYRGTREGPRPTPISEKGWNCIISIVNGRPTSRFNLVPDSIKDILAMEIYPDPRKVPQEYRMLSWTASNTQTVTGRRATSQVAAPRPRPATPCALVVYWTRNAIKP